MKGIILAAGEGKRLRPLTNNFPKCMVEFKKKQIIDYVLEAFREAGINDIYLVKGYKAEVLKKKHTKEFLNKDYDKSNMVTSLFCTHDIWDDDLIISYSDIIYNSGVLKLLKKSNEKVSVVINKNWKELWLKRMNNPLNDAETLKLNKKNFIIEIGKKPKNYSEINGQYTGIIKIKKEILPKIKSFYFSLDQKKIFDGQSFDNMYMTSFLQLIINNISPVKAVFIDGGWLEIDTLQDLKNLENYF